MGQHRTRKQKELAQLRRHSEAEKLYSLQALSPQTMKISEKKGGKSPTASLQKQQNPYIVRDMLKTLVVSVVIIALLATAWWKFR
ncbi:MAG: hypothetical protein A2804_01940 [Candidatus Pacebacteria bacterium RIFCSPHIGHO2_01_FULL_46_10]|nr:MAG: hypothetical protein A2804_01940 [Candidatus Pacebacteria bacterium RIFCSPHIGHO2_01_FULL_46_10]